MKNKILITLGSGLEVWLVMIVNCASPVLYLNKEIKNQPPVPEVYIVPTAYYGIFIYPAYDSSKGQRTLIMKETPVNDWAMFDFVLNRCLLNAFKQKGIKAALLMDQQVAADIKPFIAGDTMKNWNLQHLTLADVYKKDGDRVGPDIQNGLLLVFTQYDISRTFPKINIVTRYRIYNLESGKLLLANKIEKEYLMTGITENVFANSLYDPKVGDILNERIQGLKEDEKLSYEKICALHIDKIVTEITKYCFNK